MNFGNPFLVYNSLENVSPYLKTEDNTDILASVKDFVVVLSPLEFAENSTLGKANTYKSNITSAVKRYLGANISSLNEIADSSSVNITVNNIETALYKLNISNLNTKAGINLTDTYENADWYIDENGNTYLIYDNESNIPEEMKEGVSTNSYVTVNGGTITGYVASNNSSSSESGNNSQQDTWTGKLIQATSGVDYTAKTVTINVVKSKYDIVSIVNKTTSETLAENTNNVTTSALSNGTYEFDITDSQGNVETLTATIFNVDLVISNEAELKAFRNTVNSGTTYTGKTIIQTADIVTTGNWTPIGKFSDTSSSDQKPFMGIYDGLGHSITININNTSKYQALFTFVKGTSNSSRACVKNLVVKGSVTAQSYSAGLISRTFPYVDVINCGNEVNVSTTYGYTGGLIQNATQTRIYNCYNMGNVTGTGFTGGILGSSGGDSVVIQNCYNTGTITSNSSRCCGIVGQNYQTRWNYNKLL